VSNTLKNGATGGGNAWGATRRGKNKIEELLGCLGCGGTATEDELRVGRPPKGLSPAGEQPQAAQTALHAEDTRVAIRVGNGFHADDHPLVELLILVGQTQRGSGFGGAELES